MDFSLTLTGRNNALTEKLRQSSTVLAKLTQIVFIDRQVAD
jgi:hypothetical protein